MHVDARNRLLALQDHLLESNALFIADEVIDRICECLPPDTLLFFYMRERRRFTDEHAATEPYLRFPYLSFEFSEGSIRRFSTPEELAEREQSLQAVGWSKSETDAAVIHWKQHPGLTGEIIGLVRRAFLTFYHVCGVREHFVESVSRRFIREFVRRQGRDLADFGRHFREIRRQLGIDVAMGFQRDKFPAEPNTLEELIEVADGSSPLLGTIAQSPSFVRDLHRSISRKSINYGRVETLGLYYCVNTLIDEHFVVGQDEEAEYRLARRAVLIFLRQEDRLPLDGLHNATKLLDSALREKASVHREDPFFKVLENCQKAEEGLGTRPCKRRTQLDDVIKNLLVPFLRNVTYPASLAERVAVRRYEVFSNNLTLLADTNEDDAGFPAELPVDDPDTAAAAAFRKDESIWIARRGRDIPATDDASRAWANSIGNDDDAFHVRPIRVGSVRSGIVEFSGSRSRSLKTEDVYFQRIAGTCSEVIRRLELANDRAWLSRMSYVHAARHRIEAIIRDIQESSSEQAEQLRKLLSSYSVLDAIVAGDARGLFDSRLNAMRALLPPDDEAALVRLCDQIAVLFDRYPASDLAFGLVYEVLDTLMSNSSHSPFRADDVRVSVLPSSDGPATLEIVHAPRGALQVTKALDQVCVAPIRDRLSSTFHFGLFLLAAQLRMVGGAATSAPARDDGLGSSAFGVSFMIPLGAPSKDGSQ